MFRKKYKLNLNLNMTPNSYSVGKNERLFVILISLFNHMLQKIEHHFHYPWTVYCFYDFYKYWQVGIFPYFTSRLSAYIFQSMVAYSTVSLSFSLSLNICNDNLKASNTLSYDVASLSSFPMSSLITVRKEIVSLLNLGP